MPDGFGAFCRIYEVREYGTCTNNAIKNNSYYYHGASASILTHVPATTLSGSNCTLDIDWLSASTTGSRVFAALRGMVDAGLDIPHGDQVLPDDDRIHGAHIDSSMSDKVKGSLKAIEEA